MKSDFNLSLEDIKSKNENALELFYSGIKSAQTRRSMEGNLKTFLVTACVEIFSGDYKQRVQEFVDLTKEDQNKATSIVLAYVRKLRERASLDKSNPDYLNPSSVPNKIKPIRKLLDMNGFGLGWKRIYSLYPEKDNTNKGRAYTRLELQKMLEYSESIETDFIILASSSAGFRVGAWNDQIWGNIYPVYEINGEYKVTLEKEDKDAKVVCAAMMIYKNSPEEYITLISIEAWNKLLEYKKVWTSRMKREPVDSDPLILERRLEKNIITLTDTAVSRRILKLLIQSGMRAPLTEGKRRHEVPMTHGFRRYWDKVMMETTKKRGTLSALVIKERLMGHDGIVGTDKNYYWTDILDMVPDYLQAMPYLMISEENRLVQKLEAEKLERQRLEQANKEKDIALEKLGELEEKVRRMERFQVSRQD
ncbi:MAG: hypothetical protein ACREAR_01150 [Nitrosotalea sp.]